MIQYTITNVLSSCRPRVSPLFRLVRPLFFAFFAVIFHCGLMTGCGGDPPPQPSKVAEDPDLVLWPRAKDAITLYMQATDDLNWYDSKAHSLQVIIYQLDNPDPFLSLGRKSNGVEALLKAESFDKSVKDVTRTFIQPDEAKVETLDRVEGAKFIGIVGGYFKSTPSKSVRAWHISLQKSSEGLVFKTDTYSAGSIILDVQFKNHEIVGKKIKYKKKIKKSTQQTMHNEDGKLSEEQSQEKSNDDVAETPQNKNADEGKNIEQENSQKPSDAKK